MRRQVDTIRLVRRKRELLYSDEDAAKALGWDITRLQAVEQADGSIADLAALLHLVGMRLRARRDKGPRNSAAETFDHM